MTIFTVTSHENTGPLFFQKKMYRKDATEAEKTFEVFLRLTKLMKLTEVHISALKRTCPFRGEGSQFVQIAFDHSIKSAAAKRIPNESS